MSKKVLVHYVEQIIEEHIDDVINLRRTIHQNPELSFEEFHTSELIFNTLVTIPELIVSRPTKTSVLAILKGDKSGKVLAIRSDIDALALHEENDSDYKSRNDGVMHACGHDGHIAILMGTISILVKSRHLINGEIHFIFQHAEERPPGGAIELVSEGILAHVDMIISAHLWAALDTGTVGLRSGQVMAAPDNFEITLIGRGGHAGMPHEAIDPITISAHVITSLQNIVSRRNNPLNPLVLSITSIHGGSTYNIIPERVDIKGTVRTFNKETRKSMCEAIEKTLQGICSAFGATYSFHYIWGYDPVINDNSIVNSISKVLVNTLGDNYLTEFNPVMCGEDFSTYLKYVPGAMIFIGAGNKDKGLIFPQHHPCFDIDEKSLSIGIKVLTISALGLLNENINFC